MSIVIEQKIYENNEILKRATAKTLLTIKRSTGNIIFINVSYFDDQISSTLYSGMKYIANMRGEKKDIAPVIFYGYESLEYMKKRPEASILQSPAVEYIRMPFKLSELIEVIDRLKKANKISKSLDKNSQQILLEEKKEKIISFKHRGDNIYRGVSLNAELAREDIHEKSEKYPGQLDRIKIEPINAYLKEYEELLPLVKTLRIKGGDDIIQHLNNAIKCVEIIKGKSSSPAEAVKKAFDCAEEVKKVCDILSRVNKG